MYKIIPKPLSIIYNENSFFEIKNSFDFSSDFKNARELSKMYFKKFLNISLIDKSLYNSESNILKIKKVKDLDEEEYTLKIDEKGILISASFDTGAINAIKTLIQIVSQSSDNKLSFISIKDKPLLKRRGVMLDVSRHFMEKNNLFKILDAISLFKFNVFHFHLSDDQGFRIESKKYPNLHLIGSKRDETMDNKTPHEGYYTQEDIKEIVSFCDLRGIEVVPEIDLPGHTNAMIASYNELGVFVPENFKVDTKWGIKADLLCSWKEDVYKFIFNLLDELIPLFPSKYFHIGGDEANKTKWSQSDECIKKMKELNIKSFMDMQGYFSNRIIEFLNSRNKTAILWNDILKASNLKGNYIIQHWVGSVNNEYVNKGGKFIYSQCPDFYLDYPHGMSSLKKTYELKMKDGSIPFSLLKGAEACIWTEYLPNFETVCNFSFPRLISISENLWSEEKNYEDFKTRLPFVYNLLDLVGIKNYYTDFKDLDPSFLKTFKQSLNFKTRFQYMLRDSAKNWRNMKKTDKIVLN